MKMRDLTPAEIAATRAEARAILEHAEHLTRGLRVKLHSDPAVRGMVERAGAPTFIEAVRTLYRAPGGAAELSFLLTLAHSFLDSWLAKRAALVAAESEAD